MSLRIITDDTSETIGVQFVFELPEGVALKVLACDGLEKLLRCMRNRASYP